MQINLEVVNMVEEKEKENELTQNQKFLIELIIMIIVGLLVIVPFILWKYHFFI